MSIPINSETVARLMANTKEKGRDERFLRKFVCSQEPWIVVTDSPGYDMRENIASVKNAMTNNIKKLGESLSVNGNTFAVNLKLVKTDDDQLILVNRELFGIDEEE